MKHERTLLYVSLFIIMLLIIGLVYLNRPVKPLPAPAAHTALPESAPSFDAAAQRPEYDFTSMLDETPTAAPAYYARMPYSAGTQSYPPARSGSAPRFSAAPNMHVPLLTVPTASGVRTGRSASVPVSVRSGAAARVSSAPSSARSGTGRAYSYTDDEQDGPSMRQSMLAGWAPQQTRAQKRELDSRLKNMSSGIESAIVRSLMPKSKRTQNIEKYLNRRAGDAAQMDDGARAVASGALTPAEEVAKQIDAQAQNVVNSVGQNYGGAAAQKASSIMNDFKRDMTKALSGTGDPQEKQIRATAVNNRYNRRLQQLNEEENMKKTEEALRTENEAYLARLKEKFNPQTEAAARAQFDEYTRKKMEILAQPQSEEAMYQQLLPLEREHEDKLKKILVENNPQDPDVLKKKQEIDAELTGKRAAERQKDIEEGRVAERAFTLQKETMEEFEKDWAAERKEKVTAAQQNYGPQTAQAVQGILEDLAQKRRELFASGKDPSAVEQEYLKYSQEANKLIAETVEKTGKPEAVQKLTAQYNAHNDEMIDKTMQQMKDWPASAKKQWADQARKVLEESNQERAQLSVTAQNQEEFDARMKEINARAEARLQAIQVQVPPSPAQ